MTKLQYVGLLAAALAGGWIANAFNGETVSAEPAQKTVEAQEFVLKNKDGKVRAKIGIDENDSGSIMLYDKEGKLRATLANDANDYYGLRLHYTWGEKGGAEFVAGRNNDATLALADDKGEHRVSLFLRPKRDAGLTVLREDGTRGISLDSYGDQSSFSIAAKEYSSRFELKVTDDSGSTIALKNADGTTKWTEAAK